MSKFRIAILLLMGVSFMGMNLIGCVHTYFKDPEYGSWEYNTRNNHPNLVYTNMNGDKLDDLYATTGFFGDAAIVAKCTKFDNENKCRRIQYGVLTDDGELAPTFGMYDYPEIALDQVAPANLRYNGYKNDWANFPMWKGVSKKTEKYTIRNFAENGLIVIERSDRYGFMDLKGNVVIEPVYLAASSFTNNYAIVVNEDFVVGTVDARGNFTPEKYACMNRRNNDMIYAYTDGRISDYRTDLRFQDNVVFVSDTLKARAEEPDYNNYICTDYGSTMGMLNSKWQVRIPMKFVHLYKLSNNNILAKTRDGLWGYYSESGDEILSPVYSYILVSKHGLIVENSENLWAVCKTTGCSSHTGFIYSYVGYYYDDDNEGMRMLTSEYLRVKKGDKWGVVDMHGIETTPFIYDELNFISNDGDMMISKIGDKMGVIRNGVELYPAQFTSIGKFDDEGKALARIDNQEIYIFKSKDLETEYWRSHGRTPPPPRGSHHER